MGAPTGEATRIVAVRHGETVWNAEMRMQGQLDTALSERGRWQAARAAEALAGEGIEAIVASDLARAFDTAQAIAAVVGLPIATDVGLRERSFGVFEGHTYAEIDARWPDRGGALAPPRPGVRARRRREPGRVQRPRRRRRDAHRRARARPHDPRRQPRRRARLPVPRRVGPGLGAPRTWELGNAAINRLLFTGERFTLVGWSDTAHLDGDTLDDASEGDCPTVPRVAS